MKWEALLSRHARENVPVPSVYEVEQKNQQRDSYQGNEKESSYSGQISHCNSFAYGFDQLLEKVGCYAKNC